MSPEDWVFARHLFVTLASVLVVVLFGIWVSAQVQAWWRKR